MCLTIHDNRFHGDEHDTESNLEHTQFRQLSSVQGRWLSPDVGVPGKRRCCGCRGDGPYLGSMDLTNPQTLNMYAYLSNGPMGATDPSGLGPCEYHSGWSGECTNGQDPCSDPSYADSHADCPYMPGVPPSGLPGGGGGSTGGGAPAPEPNVNPSGSPLLSGETLGLPNGMSIQQRGLLAALGVPLPPDCEFGACGPGISPILGGIGSLPSSALADIGLFQRFAALFRLLPLPSPRMVLSTIPAEAASVVPVGEKPAYEWSCVGRGGGWADPIAGYCQYICFLDTDTEVKGALNVRHSTLQKGCSNITDKCPFAVFVDGPAPNSLRSGFNVNSCQQYRP